MKSTISGSWITSDMVDCSIEFLDKDGQPLEMAAVLKTQFLSCSKITHVGDTFGISPVIISVVDDIESKAFEVALGLMDDADYVQLRIDRYFSIGTERSLYRRTILRRVQILAVSQTILAHEKIPAIEIEVACDDAVVQYGKELS